MLEFFSAWVFLALSFFSKCPEKSLNIWNWNIKNPGAQSACSSEQPIVSCWAFPRRVPWASCATEAIHITPCAIKWKTLVLNCSLNSSIPSSPLAFYLRTFQQCKVHLGNKGFYKNCYPLFLIVTLIWPERFCEVNIFFSWNPTVSWNTSDLLQDVN